MNCPRCKSRTKVVDVRSISNMKARKRICPECKFTFYTTEIIEEGHQTYNQIWKEINIEREEKRLAKLPVQMQIEL